MKTVIAMLMLACSMASAQDDTVKFLTAQDEVSNLAKNLVALAAVTKDSKMANLEIPDQYDLVSLTRGLEQEYVLKFESPFQGEEQPICAGLTYTFVTGEIQARRVSCL